MLQQKFNFFMLRLHRIITMLKYTNNLTVQIIYHIGFLQSVWMFALDQGIGYSVDLRPEYLILDCLAGVDIGAVYSDSISRRRSPRQKTRRPNSEPEPSTLRCIRRVPLPSIDDRASSQLSSGVSLPRARPS
jgi:hypothetical protein